MATIKHYKEDALKTGEFTLYEGVGSVGQWIVDNISHGQAFSVFTGQPCKENAIELTPEVLATLPDGDYIVMNTPAGVTAAFAIVALVVAVAVIRKKQRKLKEDDDEEDEDEYEGDEDESKMDSWG